jgi:hypothetical protein
MTTEKVSDLEIVSLKSFFDAGKFRLIPADVVHFSGGISEVPVEFNLHTDFAKRLKFDTRNLQTLYGFGRIEKELIAINQGDYYSPARKGKLKAVELNDCGELWILKFEFFDLMIKLYAVKPSEVEELLNECRKPAMLDYAIL